MKFFIFIFFTTISATLFSQVSMEWSARYNNFNDQAVSIAIDNQGNILVTGSSTGTGSEQDYLTIKYNTSGNQIWSVRYNGTGNSYDTPSKIIVDDHGNSYITGASIGNGTGYDIATVKYDSSGNEIWSVRYNGDINGNDKANSIAVDKSGNVFVTGYYSDAPFSISQITLKYNSNGELKHINSSNEYSESIDIKVDLNGNSYVTGVVSRNFGSFDDIYIIKYDSLGNTIWINNYNGNAQDDVPFALELDSSDNVIVTGRSIGNDSENDIITLKYNSNGTFQWAARYSRNPNSSDVATCMTLDNNGNIIVAGFSQGNFITIKYTESGIQQWVAIYDGPSNNTEGVNSICADEFGNIYVTGHSVGTGQFFDYVTIKYNSNGIEKWFVRYSGKGDRNDKSYDLALDKTGNLFVTGFSVNEFLNADYLTIKYSQTVGIISQNNSNPIKFYLSQNYPNPFNPSSMINYELGITNFVKLIVYDVLGNEVATLVNEKQNAGSYSVEFDGNGFASGVYFYKMEAGDFAKTKRMILLK